MKWSFAVLVASIGAVWACNVLDNADVVFDKTGFVAEELELLVPAIVKNSYIQLVDNSAGFSSNAWLVKKERISEGFIADFEFLVDGNGDGVAFVVQNDKIFDTYGGARENLGFVSSTLTNYLGIGFQTCRDGLPSCSTQSITVHTRKDGNTPILVDEQTVSGIDMTGQRIKARVVYTEQPSEVKVFIALAAGGTFQEVLSTPLADTLVDIFDSPFGHMGFTASSSAGITGFINVYNLKLSQQPSAFAVTTGLGETIDFGSTIIFDVIARDSCQQKIPVNNESVVESTLTFLGKDDSFVLPENPIEGRDFFIGEVSNNSITESFSVRYDLPVNVVGRWRLNLTVDGVLAQGMPLDAAIVTKQPDQDEGIPTWGLALLITIISLIVIGLVYSIHRLKRYREKLKAHQEDIEAGKEKHKLDVLDKDVSYNMNPMLGSLDEMKAKLAENEKELERLRAGKSNLYDDDYTIESLQEQNRQLREEMNKLKKEAQQNEAQNANFRQGGPAGKQAKRKEFDQRRA